MSSRPYLFVAVAMLLIPILSWAGMKWDIDETRWLSLGVGARADFRAEENGAPDNDTSKEFQLDSARLYLNGQILPYLKVELNTEKQQDDQIRVLDALAKFEFSESFNVWAGRLLPPSDRSNLSGPYYLSTFDFPFVQQYPAVFAGRDDGVAVWGLAHHGLFKYQGGIFNGPRGNEANPSDNLLYSGRLVLNFLDPEPGYYNSSTYYGEKDVLAIGLVGMWQAESSLDNSEKQGGFDGGNLDALFEKKLASSGVVTLEGAAYFYDVADRVTRETAFFVLGAYLLPGHVGKAQFQPHVRYQKLHLDGRQNHKRTDIGVNMLLKGHDARLSFVYSIDRPSEFDETKHAFVTGLQIQL